MQEIPNGIGNIGNAVRQPADGTLNAINDSLNDVPSPVPGIRSQSLDISHSGIESILNGGFDAADFVGNRRTDLIPDRGYHRKNGIHYTGNRAGDAVPDGRNYIPDRRQDRRNETRYSIPNRSHHILNCRQNRGDCIGDGIPDGFKCRSDAL